MLPDVKDYNLLILAMPYSFLLSRFNLKSR